MKYIIVKAESNSDGTISFSGVRKIIQKGSSKEIEWIDLKEGVGNTIDPEQSDYLFFDDKDLAESFISDLEEGEESVAVLGVNAD